jgi:hypothetical protein
MILPKVRQGTTRARIVAAVAIVLSFPAAAQSTLSVGPRSVQTLILQQLFNRAGRWYLIDDGGCYTYLESPETRLSLDRLVLRARLTSRLGQSLGKGCLGGDFASDIALSGKLRGSGHELILDDVRIDRVDDESTRNALNLALQLDPQLLPRSTTIDVTDFLSKDILAAGGSPAHLDAFHIINITTPANVLVIQFVVSLSAP